MSPPVAPGSVEAPPRTHCMLVGNVVSCCSFIEHWLFIYKSIYVKKRGRRETPTVCVVLLPGTICRDSLFLCFGLCIPVFLGFLHFFFFATIPSIWYFSLAMKMKAMVVRTKLLLSCFALSLPLPVFWGTRKEQGNRSWEARE